jgi:hypothetical protein
MPVGLGMDGAAEQGPSVAVVGLDVVTVVEQVAQAVQVVVRNGLMSGEFPAAPLASTNAARTG